MGATITSFSTCFTRIRGTQQTDTTNDSDSMPHVLYFLFAVVALLVQAAKVGFRTSLRSMSGGVWTVLAVWSALSAVQTSTWLVGLVSPQVALPFGDALPLPLRTLLGAAVRASTALPRLPA